MKQNSTNNRLIWLGGRTIPVAKAKINVLAPTSQFGANVFEGIRCYWNKDDRQLYGFRIHDHHKRLKDSMRLFRMDDAYTIEEMRNAFIKTIKANKYKEDIAVRQTVFIDGFGSWSSSGPVNMFVAPIPQGRSNKAEIACCVSSWTRISDRNMSPRMKTGANYINSRSAQIEAISNGYDSAIFMNEQGKIAEGPGSCLFIVRDGRLITPPVTASILESITRSTIIELAGKILGVTAIERDINRTELYTSEEAFLCGSAMEVMPIKSIDRFQLKSSAKSSLTSKLRDLYLEVVHGLHKEYNSWLTPIY